MIIESSELLSVLRRTSRLVVRLDESGVAVERITAEEAMKIVGRTPYTGVIRGRNSQVRSIRPVCTRKPKPLTDAYPGMPVLWTIGYRRSTPGLQLTA